MNYTLEMAELSLESLLVMQNHSAVDQAATHYDRKKYIVKTLPNINLTKNICFHQSFLLINTTQLT